MRTYDTAAAFQTNLGHVRKWMRCGQAIDQSPAIRPGEAYSLGDSLTFWNAAADALADAEGRYVGHRRYHAVLSPIDGVVDVEVVPKAALDTVVPYDDTTDREWFAAAGGEAVGDAMTRITLNPGAVLIVEEDEALRVVTGSEARVTVVHVTVEGFTFPNK